MSPIFGQAFGRALRETSGHLRVEFGLGTVTQIAEIYRAFAVMCLQKQINRVLIVAGDDEPAGARALRDAATVMALAGTPADFRLALVAAAPRVARVYRNAQYDLSAAGVTTRLFENEAHALQWLDGAAR